jgi:hypothetical protein
MMKRSLTITLFWLSLVVAGLLLGVAEDAIPPNTHRSTTISTEASTTINWDAIGALSVIAFGFVSGTWFIVSMAIHSAMDSRFEKFRVEMHKELNDPDTGFVLARECKLLHDRTREELIQLREQAVDVWEKREVRGDN